MARIFVSHSHKDKEIIHFFLEAFAGTHVKPHLEELEKPVPSGVTADKIESDIRSSNAVFVLLTESVESLQHTRDWITWECGIAGNKDIWVFEPLGSLGKVRVVVPRFRHYALFEITEEWRNYLRSIIDTYDDSHVIPVLSATTGAGAVLSEDDPSTGAAGGFVVGLAGLLLQSMSKPSFGIGIKCLKCFSNYRIHRYGNFRCPVCNADLVLYPPELVPETESRTY